MKEGTASRLAWSLWAVAVALGAAGMTLVVLNDPEGGLFEDALFFTIFLAMATVGALVASRQPGNAIGWLFLAMGPTAAVTFVGDEYARYALITHPGSLPGAVWGAWIGDLLWVVILGMSIVFIPLLFPDGRLPTQRWRPFLWLCSSYLAFVLVVFAFDPGKVGPAAVRNPLGVDALGGLAVLAEGVGYFVVLGLGIVSVASLVLRFRRAGGAQRQQIKWFVFAAAVFALSFVSEGILGVLGIDGGVILETAIPAVAFMALPVGAGIGILRYRLFDIDVVINRTVLFGLLAAFITLVYVGVVIGIGALVGSRASLPLSIAATAIIAVLFQPVTARARRFANRLVYGKRATPYEVLSTFSEHLGGAYSSEEILPQMARMIGEATGAQRAGVWVRVGDELRPAASWPVDDSPVAAVSSPGDDLPDFPDGERALAVRHQGELLGALTVTISRREALNPTQQKLLEDLSAQAGLLLRNVRLIEELLASRQRLVAAQDEERRRLERNIHDGAQQQLVALAVKVRLARTLTGRDVERAQSLLDELQGETQETLENLRDLARGIYPPLLADQGLAAALEAQARKVPFPVEVQRDGVGRYPAEAEATAYFCVLEALQNVAKYAQASQVTVRLRTEDGQLVFTVQDDGRGFDVHQTPSGSGLQNMKDRLDALGGTIEITSAPGQGTTITGRVPVSK